MKPSIGITESNRKAVADQLSILLADEYILYTKTRNAHWNVVGIDFMDKHKFFENQYDQIEQFIDDVAERIRTLGFTSPASLTEFMKLTQLKEKKGEKNDSKTFIEALLSDHETIIQFLRKNITAFDEDYKDMGSSDFITALIQDHEKMAWILRSHLI